MGIRARLFAAGVLTVFLFGCATGRPVTEVRTVTVEPFSAVLPRPILLPEYAERTAPPKLAERAAAKRADIAVPAAAPERAGTPAKRPAARAKKNGSPEAGKEATRLMMLAESRSELVSARRVSPENTAAAAASPEFDADAALLARRDAYHQQLKQAAYTFNPLSPIKVATPITVFFWIDPVAEPLRLAEELKAALLRMRPDEVPLAESGRLDWSPKMRATLTGDDFEITPTEGKNFDGQKILSGSRRTEWSWDIKARRVGEKLPMHLRVWAVLPAELGEPYEVLKLDKLIHVEVTFLWLLDEFWEKYWKWILGGIGTVLAGAIGTWWKSRQPKSAGG
jgi:hypothetical protein